MPWESKTVERAREEFVLASKRSVNFSSLCREFGITRKTGYKWLRRYENQEELSDRSKCPKTIANKTDTKIENEIVQLRIKNPEWGGTLIKKVLENQGIDNLPSAKTCNSIIKRNHLIDPVQALKHHACQRFERENCNELWQTDFKGDFALLDGSRCYPLTILDDHSRFSIMIDAKANTLGVTDSFKQAFHQYGVPDSVLSDNGAQFAGFRGGYTKFERWLMDHNILPIHGRIMHPQTQGKIERFHRTMKNELLKYNKYENLTCANEGLQQWRTKYNEVRPHTALNLKCPSEVYTPSYRRYVDKVKPFEYSGTYHVIKVNTWGYLRFDKWQEYLSETMIGEYIEIRHNPHGDSFIACYRNFKIAEFDTLTGVRINRRISRL